MEGGKGGAERFPVGWQLKWDDSSQFSVPPRARRVLVAAPPQENVVFVRMLETRRPRAARRPSMSAQGEVIS